MSSEAVEYRRHPNGGGIISGKLSASDHVYIARVRITGEGEILKGRFFSSVPVDSDPQNEPSRKINIQNAFVDGWFKIEAE